MNRVFIASYTSILLFFAIFSYTFIDPNLFYLRYLYTGFATDYRSITTAIYTTLICLLFLFYFFFSWLVYKNKLHMREALLLIVITTGILFFSYPAMLSYDIFNYITTAKVIFHYQENPYVVMPIEIIGEPFLSFTRAANKIALYGPIWILLTGIPYLLSFGNFILLLFGFKLFVALFYILTVILIWKITKNLSSVVFFAINPLVVIETLVSGHNDIVMVFFAMSSFYLLMHKKLWWGLFFLFFSIFIKYATVFLVPIYIFTMWSITRKKKIKWGKVFFSCALFMGIAFFLSPLREEIYPWYAIWFLGFISLIKLDNFLIQASYVFSFSLLFRYTPYLLFGTYLPPTPIIKSVITFIPLFIFSIYYAIKNKI